MLLRNQSYEPGMAMPFTVSLANFEPQAVTSSIDCRSSSMLSPSPRLVEEEGTVKPSLHRSSTYRARSVSDLSRRRSTSSRSAFDSLPTSYDHGRKPSMPQVRARSNLPVSMDPRGATNGRTNHHHEDRDRINCGSSETIGSLRTDGTAMKRPLDASWSRSHSCSLLDSVGYHASNPWGLSANSSVWDRSFRSSQTSARTIPSLKAADCDSGDVATHQLTNVAHGAEAIARQVKPSRNGQESVTSSEGSANDQRRTPSVIKRRLSPISGSVVATESPGRNSLPSHRSSEADLFQSTPDTPASQRVSTTIPAQSKDIRGTRTRISRQMSLEASAAYEDLRRQHCASLFSSEDTSHGDFLAAKNSCEQIFMPRPVLRVKTEEQIWRQSYFLGSSQSPGSTFRTATFERNRRPPTGSNVDHEHTQDLSPVARHRPRSKSFPALLKPAHLGLTTARRGSKDAVQPDLPQEDSQPHFSPAAELPSRAASLDVDELLQEREAFEAERLQWRVRQSHAFEFIRSRRKSLVNPPTSASSALFADGDFRITTSGRELLRAGPRPQSKSRMPGRGSRMMHESLMVLAQEDRAPGRSTDVSEASRSPRPTLRKTKSSPALSDANVTSDRVRTKDSSSSHGDFLNRFSRVLPQRLRPSRPESWLQRTTTTQKTGTAVSRTSDCSETGARLSASPEGVLSNSAASAGYSAIAKRENTQRLSVGAGQARLGKQRSATTSTGSVRHSSLQRAGSPPPRQFPPPNEPLPALPRLPEIYRSTTALSFRASNEASPSSRDTILMSPRQGSSPDKLVTSRRKPVPALLNEEPMLRSAEASGAVAPANLAVSHEAGSRDASATHCRTRSDMSATNSIDFRPDSLLDPHRSSLEDFGGGGGGIGLGEPEDAEHVKPVNEVEEVLEAGASV